MVNLVPKAIRFLRFSLLSTSSPFSRVSFKPSDVIAWTRLHSTSASFTEYEYDDEIPDDVKATEKHTALRVALSKVASDFVEESTLSPQHFFGARRASVVSTGSLRLDQALGIGGLPKGRMVEIYGQEASGKTTLALHIIKEAQKLGGYCAYLDVENAMNPLFAESIGVNTDNLLISQPNSAENLLSIVDTLTKSGSIDVIVVDSVRRILRSDQGSIRAEEVTCGGNALRFYAAVRMRINRKGLLRTEDKVTGLGICVQVVKNKLAPSMTKAELNIQFGRGFCCESEAFELACEHGILSTDRSCYFINGKVLNNKEDAVSYLAANKGALDEIVRTLRHRLFNREK